MGINNPKWQPLSRQQQKVDKGDDLNPSFDNIIPIIKTLPLLVLSQK